MKLANKETKTPSTPPRATAGTTAPPDIPADCPADVETLGRSTWTFLHTLAATYPATASPAKQAEMTTFMTIFSKIYPCWVCAEDFQGWMAKPENKVEKFVAGQDDFGQWLCRAHNDVNRKLGKKEFDCGFWKERWRDGWKDGRCG
jgi:FAD-linked sulfhydryl oxidase